MACQSAPNQSEANPQDVDTTALQSQGAAEASPNASATAAVKKQEGAVKYAKPAPPAHKKYTLPAGTHVPVRLIDTISTETNQAGDTFLASLAEPLTVNGVTLFAKDTSVQGKIVSLEEPGRLSGVASISLQLTEIQPKKGNSIPLQTEPFSETAKSEKKKDAAIIGGGAAIGTAIGAITGERREPRSAPLRWYRLCFGDQRQTVEISFRNTDDLQASRTSDRNTLSGKVSSVLSERLFCELLHWPLTRKKPVYPKNLVAFDF